MLKRISTGSEYDNLTSLGGVLTVLSALGTDELRKAWAEIRETLARAMHPDSTMQATHRFRGIKKTPPARLRVTIALRQNRVQWSKSSRDNRPVVF